jgi:O-methyltransferase involved in polyketide biosynthesis
MSNDYSEDQQAILSELAGHKANGERLAQQFADHRAAVRERALTAVTHYGISVMRAAQEAGIDRRTLTTWLQVHNAENKGRRK